MAKATRKGRRPDKYPRPFPDKSRRKFGGKKKNQARTVAELRAILRPE